MEVARKSFADCNERPSDDDCDVSRSGAGCPCHFSGRRDRASLRQKETASVIFGWKQISCHRNDVESTHLRDVFGHQRLEEKKYTAGQIDARWTDVIEQDYRAWLKQNENHLSVPKEQIEEILKEHQ
jgi:hypothetical protein